MARRETFVTVEDNLPFDILICKQYWDEEIPKAASPISGCHRTKGRLVKVKKQILNYRISQADIRKPSAKHMPNRKRRKRRMPLRW